MREFSLLALVLITFFSANISANVSKAEDSFDFENRPEKLGQCTGLLYKSKKEGVPVYQEADTTSLVIAHLSLGEEVCYVGEKDEFAILHWEKNSASANEKEKHTLAYARLVDLWANERYQKLPQDETNQIPRPRNFFQKIKSYYYYLRSGGVPEDGLVPYRPIIGPHGYSESSAGSQCSESCEEIVK